MKRKFGTIDGREVFLNTLSNSSGAEFSISNYGGIVTSLKFPNRTGQLDDMVLGFATLDDYLDNNLFSKELVGCC